MIDNSEPLGLYADFTFYLLYSLHNKILIHSNEKTCLHEFDSDCTKKPFSYIKLLHKSLGSLNNITAL